MDDLRIVGWDDFDNPYPTPKYSKEDFYKVVSLVLKEMKDNGYIFSGQEHQFEPTGAPIFSDGTCFRASMRSWGEMMALIYQGENGEKLSYMDFYMSLGDKAVMPPLTEIDVEPAKIEETLSGCLNQQDIEILNETISMGMPFMTLDKVLKKVYEENTKE